MQASLDIGGHFHPMHKHTWAYLNANTCSRSEVFGI